MALLDDALPLEFRLAVDVRQGLVSLGEIRLECFRELGLAKRPFPPAGGIDGGRESQVHLGGSH